MTGLLTAAEMRAAEQAAISSGEVTGLELMERAGRGVVDATLAWRPALASTPHRAVVLAGPGNNGGDGFVVARLLRARGWEVEVLLYGDPGRLPPDAAANALRWRAEGAVRPLVAEGAPLAPADLVIDAVFGTGLTRPLPADLLDAVEHLLPDLDGAGRIVAVDAPSGLCLDSGRPLGECGGAGLTVTFHAPKLGHFLAEGPARCGRLAVVDIGLSHDAPAAARLADRAATRRLGKSGAAHKYAHGHALILSGGVGRGGAARLAARGALRIGAGLVTLGCPPAALIENAARLDAIMLRAVREPAALATLDILPKLTAIGLGFGFGTGERARETVRAVLATGRPAVLDADALTSFEDDPEALFALLRGRPALLTPHAGEFARLFPDIAARLAAPPDRGPAFSKSDAVREAAARAGCTILLKGPDTVIADPSGAVVVSAAAYDRAAPWLATAGSGDVLAGLATGLLARGLAPLPAAEAAAWLHVECARRFGPGLIAEDLPETLPSVLRDLGL